MTIKRCPLVWGFELETRAGEALSHARCASQALDFHLLSLLLSITCRFQLVHLVECSSSVHASALSLCTSSAARQLHLAPKTSDIDADRHDLLEEKTWKKTFFWKKMFIECFAIFWKLMWLALPANILVQGRKKPLDGFCLFLVWLAWVLHLFDGSKINDMSYALTSYWLAYVAAAAKQPLEEDVEDWGKDGDGFSHYDVLLSIFWHDVVQQACDSWLPFTVLFGLDPTLLHCGLPNDLCISIHPHRFVERFPSLVTGGPNVHCHVADIDPCFEECPDVIGHRFAKCISTRHLDLWAILPRSIEGLLDDASLDDVHVGWCNDVHVRPSGTLQLERILVGNPQQCHCCGWSFASTFASFERSIPSGYLKHWHHLDKQCHWDDSCWHSSTHEQWALSFTGGRQIFECLGQGEHWNHLHPWLGH